LDVFQLEPDEIAHHGEDMIHMQALITGASGLIGRALLAQLPDAVVTSRDPGRASHLCRARRAVRWNPDAEAPPLETLGELDTIFHLAGEPVAEGRWTDEKKRRIRDSRIVGTRHLVAGLAMLARKPSVLVSASAIGYYGDRGDEELDEDSAPGQGFLADVCGDWERQARAAEHLGIRVVCVRIGIVLAAGGGALARMIPPFKLGAGGRLGGGKQWMPWVHIDDVVGALLHSSQSPELHGPLNAVAPTPVTNAEFTSALGHALHRPALLPIPRVALRIAFGEMSQIMMASQRVVPRTAVRTGYAFKYPRLDGALAAVLAAPHRTAA
jgi:uncharacterized protein (TIGR01777 family)